MSEIVVPPQPPKNLYIGSSDEWQTIEDSERYQEYKFPHRIDLSSIDFDSIEGDVKLSISMDLRNITSARASDTLYIYLEVFRDTPEGDSGQTQLSTMPSTEITVGDEARRVIQPLSMYLTTDSAGRQPIYADIYIRSKYSRNTRISFEYSKVQVEVGEATEWDDGTIDDGIVKIEDRFSPRIQVSGIGVYPLTKEQLIDFFRDLWTETLTEKYIYSVNGDPMNSILSIKYYYGIGAVIPRTANPAYITLGNVQFNGAIPGTNAISTHPAKTEYVQFDVGELKVPERYGNFLDLNPYTQVELYIPFYGFHSLDATEVSGKYVKLIYNINIITGVSSANIYVRGSSSGEYRFITSVVCEMGVEIPVNIQASDSFLSRLYNNTAKMAGTIGSVALASSVPMMAGLSAGIMGGPINKGADQLTTGFTGGVGGQLVRAKRQGRDLTPTQALDNTIAAEESAISGLTNGLSVPQFSPTSSSRSSSMNSETASMGDFQPYMYITTPIVRAPADYNELVGSPDFSSGKIKDYDGYIKVGSINNDGFTIPKKAFDEIHSVLKGGVYVE